MKHQIFPVLAGLFFVLAFCACAAEAPNPNTVAVAPVVPPKEVPAPVPVAPPLPETDDQKDAPVPTVTAPPAPAETQPAVSPPAQEASSAQKVLDFAREQLPKQPIRMNGSLKERAPNGFVKKELTIEMDLNWGADPANATYRIRDEKTGLFQTLEIQWVPGGPVFNYAENSVDSTNFNPAAEIDGLGATWDDLSFSFLWSFQADVLKSDKKLGHDCYVVAVPRGGNRLLLWIEKETGRLFGAKEETQDGKLLKEIKVVSVKEFDDIWMVKDIDIIRPSDNGRTSLKIDNVEAVELP